MLLVAGWGDGMTRCNLAPFLELHHRLLLCGAAWTPMLGICSVETWSQHRAVLRSARILSAEEFQGPCTLSWAGMALWTAYMGLHADLEATLVCLGWH